ncbi:MAG: ribosome-binding factor A [Alphaproteobacteria bacterium]|nr:ribosome-binding factor A [Alphaproteobacteria bacterium]|tara:strand:- start:61 stop:492 length:432 start_codon:yes stop_codon:yes gene_type:complete
MKRSAREASQRQLRVGEELRHALADLFNRGVLRDPDVAGRPITVTEVRPSPDLKNATVYVMPLGGKETEGLLVGLGRCAPFLTAEISKRVYLKFAPCLRFEIDQSFDRVDRIESLLRSPEVARDLESEEDESAPETGSGPGVA